MEDRTIHIERDPPHSLGAAAKLRLILTLPALVLLLAGCQVNQADQHSSSRLKETRRFWETLNQAAADAPAILASQPGSAPLAPAILEYLVESERERLHTIADLPLQHVHPDLLAYAAKFVKARTDLANFCDDLLVLTRRQEDILSAPVLGFGFLMNLLNRRDEPEGGFVWRALIDSAHQTGEELQSLSQPANALEAKAISVRRALWDLTAEELAVRAKLTQQFSVEFPPASTYAAAVPTEPKPLTGEEVTQSLMGQRITGSGWKFDSPREVLALKIEKLTHPNQALAHYDVNTHVRGLYSGQEHNFQLRLTYGRLKSGWKLIEVRQLP